MPFPFEVGFDEVRNNLDACVDAVFGCLESEFLVMPKGDGFVEFPLFAGSLYLGFRSTLPESLTRKGRLSVRWIVYFRLSLSFRLLIVSTIVMVSILV